MSTLMSAQDLTRTTSSLAKKVVCMLPNPELDAVIASGYSEGRERFGDFGLDPDTYALRIHAIIEKHLGVNPPPEEALRFVKGLHCRDLYLATACAQHSFAAQEESGQGTLLENAGRAWTILESTYKGFIRDLSRFFFRKGFVARDLADNILADLFLPDRSGNSRIVSYDGRSSLSTWLRVVISNRAINAQRSSGSTQSVELLTDIPDEPALQNIDSRLRGQRYQSTLEGTLNVVCRGLTSRERLILLWRYEDDLQLGQIAQLLGIHQSNVTRQLERLQSKVRDQVVSILSAEHGLSLAAIEECLNDIVEHPQSVAILTFIKNEQPGYSHPPGAVPTRTGDFSPHIPPAKPPVSEARQIKHKDSHTATRRRQGSW
jgi:RNA polymerase sigma factor (sigma-70 family)